MDKESVDLTSLYGDQGNSSNDNNVETSLNSAVQDNNVDVSQQSSEVNFDPNTGEPVNKQPEMNFDPNTGLPINKQPEVNFDPNTGLPINKQPEVNFDPNTGLPINNQQNVNVINQVTPVKSNKYNKNAIIAFLISIVSLFVFGWLSFCSLGLCVAAYNEIKKKGEKGKVLVIITFILSSISMAGYFYVVFYRK